MYIYNIYTYTHKSPIKKKYKKKKSTRFIRIQIKFSLSLVNIVIKLCSI